MCEQKKQVEKLLASADEGKMIQEGIKTVILGKPNAGKSSLLNLLAGEEKAIVTDIAGTTRDVLEETIVLQGISLRMMDTAGIRATEDVVEKIGVERARAYAKDADLVLYVVDSSIPLDENDEEILEILRDKKAIILLNKSDLTPVVTKEMLEARTDMPVLAISARQEQGVELLEEQIKSMFLQENCPLMMKYILRMSAIRRRLRKRIRALRWWKTALPWRCRKISSLSIL